MNDIKKLTLEVAMKRMLLAATIICIFFALNGCGGGSDTVYVQPVTYQALISSDSVYDGDIVKTPANLYTVTQGMSPTVQSVFAGIDPSTLNEYRAFLDFPLSGRVPANAIIKSAFIDIIINNIHPPTGIIPIRIELVTFQPPILLANDFDRILQPPLQYTTIVPAIYSADVGRNVRVDVTALMVEAQLRVLPDFQIRILEDFGVVYPGLIEINDTTGVNRGTLAPLLTVDYY